jgi:proline dehydrogenase
MKRKETEENFERAADEYIDIIRYAALQKNIPAICVKITRIARFGLLQKLNAAPRLRSGSLDNEVEAAEWQKIRKRMIRICDTADETGIGILVDAEESWIQDPIDRLTIDMMLIYNKGRALVYNTLQMYRTDRFDFLKLSHRIAKIHNFVVGIKLVRGAYIKKEHERAAQMGYPSPFFQNQDNIDNAFDNAIAYCIENMNNIDCVICTHNEESIRKATSLPQAQDLSQLNRQIHFSQLYGISDNITFNLAEKGYSVTKTLPFGNIRDAIPYLMQLAKENSGIKKQISRYLALIKKELERRKQNN